MRIWKEEQLGLLEYLYLQAGCMYLSDLSQTKYRFHIQYALWDLSPDRFSLKEWDDAVVHITQRERSFETKEQAWQFLLDVTAH